MRWAERAAEIFKGRTVARGELDGKQRGGFWRNFERPVLDSNHAVRAERAVEARMMLPQEFLREYGSSFHPKPGA
ncbi:hypothetical protein LBMAG56_44730 [Verrucomicrobiota bacterium]|nr:hypothetical protein LBMAG56_44730 [Verrucomicrobiota bacterium]